MSGKVNVHVSTVDDHGDDKTLLQIEQWGECMAYVPDSLTEEQTARVLLMDWGMDAHTAECIELVWHRQPMTGESPQPDQGEW